MAPPKVSRSVRKDQFPSVLKALKTTAYYDAGRDNRLVTNIRGLAWSPTGNAIATTVSNYIRIWDPDRTKVAQSLELKSGAPGIVEKVAYCPTHEAVLASTAVDGICRLWDARMPGGVAGASKGTKLSEAKVGDTGLFLTWHPSGTELLVGRKDDVVMSVDVRKLGGSEGALGTGWDLEARQIDPLQGRHGKTQLNEMAFSNSGRELLVTTGHGPVEIYDWPSLDYLHTLTAHNSAAYSVRHSPAGSFIAAGSGDGMVTLWDTTHWHCAHTMMAHTGPVRDLSFSYDGAYIACGSGGDTKESSTGIEISHVDTGERVHTIDTVAPASWIAWHPLRYWLAYAGETGGLRIVGAGSST
nr:hypothetical protein B0A51_05795 [Rachicladosporium sp. CCFEE 5018]